MTGVATRWELGNYFGSRVTMPSLVPARQGPAVVVDFVNNAIYYNQDGYIRKGQSNSWWITVSLNEGTRAILSQWNYSPRINCGVQDGWYQEVEYYGGKIVQY